MNTLDIIVVAVLALSALHSFVRGFVRAVLSIAVWIAAGVVTYYLFDMALPTARRFITTVWLADVTTVVVLFVLCLLPFSYLVGVISSQVRASGLGAIDRILGLVFGLALGAFGLCVCFLILERVLPDQTSWPNWIAEANSRPALARGAERLAQLIPRQIIERGNAAVTKGQNLIKSADKAGEAADALHGATDPAPPPATEPPPAQQAPGYTPDQRRDLNNALEKMQGKQ